jgi:hypothetical protein
MKNDNPLKDVSSPHEHSLRWAIDMIYYLINSVCSNFSGNFVTDIYQACGSILLNMIHNLGFRGQ